MGCAKRGPKEVLIGQVFDVASTARDIVEDYHFLNRMATSERDWANHTVDVILFDAQGLTHSS
jgi:hypothetical protein